MEKVVIVTGANRWANANITCLKTSTLPVLLIALQRSLPALTSRLQCVLTCCCWCLICVCVCSGIGRALCDRLLSEDGGLRLCLACRNMERAEAARSALLRSHSQASVDLLKLDVDSTQSVLCAAQEIKAKYGSTDRQAQELIYLLRTHFLFFLFFYFFL